VSAKGFTYGYVGSILLLITNLLIITFHEKIGISEDFAVRSAFVMVGLWWLGFAQAAFKRMPKDSANPPGENLIKKGFDELKNVWHQLKGLTFTKRFLFSFFFYNAGVQTILFLAATFAEKELGFATSELIILILILQLVAIAGAFLFAKISDWKGNKVSIACMLLIWMALCVAAYVVQEKIQFYLLAVALGSVMGGIQSMSRSTYSKLIPQDTKDTTSFFSFYDVIDKTSTVVGTFGFGLVQLMGGMRNAILGLSGFFLIGLLILLSVKMRGNEE
jgi:UMF1 family MFS transporter